MDDSAFIKVHDNDFLLAKHRLYMTATPRIYTDEAKKKARQGYAELCSMDDESKYGREFYRIGFSEAVEKGLLSDYKVVVLTIGEDQIPASLQNAIAKNDTEISVDSAAKLIGCVNALSKKMTLDSLDLKEVDPGFMHTALAFCSNIKTSKAITNIFNEYAGEYYHSLSPSERAETVKIASEHVDGSMNAIMREEKLQWLKETDTTGKDCHILTNVRCLSEGVDVPALDAIIFLSARNSQVDVVQSVGRVMRKAPINSGYDKKYGYIIIPVVVPPNVEPEVALEESKDFGTVWSVLNALRAHDDRFNSTINKIELNKTRPEQILVGSVPKETVYGTKEDGTTEYVGENKRKYIQTTLYFSELQNAIYARMVKKVGTKRYWEDWAKNIAEIARRHKERIEQLIEKGGEHKKAFDKFLNGLHKNINPHITTEDAIDMLSQHMITQPVFEALFENYSFVKNNPISKSMNEILALLDKQGLEKEREELDKFYQAVRKGCEGVDNAEGKQKIIIELYDKFFKLALPKTVGKLGIVYTPVEVVDFILNSVNDILKKEFGRKHGLSEENIHILDPFTGTGTFITRLLQLGLIRKEDLVRKYTSELHANEIVLLAYYIASINIENTFHDIAEQDKYIPFEGICLTDTFQLGERLIKNEKGIAGDGFCDIWSDVFPTNSKRVIEQKKIPMKVIIGNPPYSVGQRSANDNAQNETYPKLEQRIAETYAAGTKATNKSKIYDSYIKAFRWASDRIDNKTGGIIAFVTNSGWLDNVSMGGFRHCLEKEFSSIYIFNLRGAVRGKSGEAAKKEGTNVFDIMTGVVITVLIKNPKKQNTKAEVYYHDIGDYLSRKEKLQNIVDLKSCMNTKFSVKVLKPNEKNDWINHRNSIFENYILISPKEKSNIKSKSIFIINAIGVSTNRDSWVYNYSIKKLSSNMQNMINFYNHEYQRYINTLNKKDIIDINDFIQNDKEKIKWTRGLKNNLKRKIKYTLKKNDIIPSLYRPFQKGNLYYSNGMIESPGIFKQLFPTIRQKNLLICVSGVGGLDFAVLITNAITDLAFVKTGNGGTQCFPLYYYEKREKVEQSLFDNATEEYIRHDGITDFIFNQARDLYGNKVTKEDIFFYVYGFLHLPKYRTEFAADLKKSLPRLFLVDEPKVFWQISQAGCELADIHLNYEHQKAPEGVIIEGDCGDYTVQKMKFPKKDKQEQKDTIIYNNDITIKNIPSKVYDYVVNGRSPVEWVMERYQVKIDKASGIENNPNDWATEHNEPRYILDLLLSVMTVSLKTQEIVDSLPNIKFE